MILKIAPSKVGPFQKIQSLLCLIYLSDLKSNNLSKNIGSSHLQQIRCNVHHIKINRKLKTSPADSIAKKIYESRARNPRKQMIV